jgi:hypothetical protein
MRWWLATQDRGLRRELSQVGQSQCRPIFNFYCMCLVCALQICIDRSQTLYKKKQPSHPLKYWINILCVVQGWRHRNTLQNHHSKFSFFRQSNHCPQNCSNEVQWKSAYIYYIRDGSYGPQRRSINTQYAHNTVPYFMQFGVPVFDPKWTQFAPKSPKTFPILFNILCAINILYNRTGSPLKGRCWGGNCLKSPKNGKKRQILQSYNTAQFVQYGKIRVKYHTA